jgi:arylsulfatase A
MNEDDKLREKLKGKTSDKKFAKKKKRSKKPFIILGIILVLIIALVIYIFVRRHFNGVTDKRPDMKEAFLDTISPADRLTDAPNIILILTDDLGYGDIGCYGSTAISTPNIDQMANEGIKLTSYYSTASICSPARAGILTGRYFIRTGLTDALLNPDTLFGFGQSVLIDTEIGLPQDEVTFPSIFQKAGYETALIGKWHLGNKHPHLPSDHGFDLFYGSLWSNDQSPFQIYRNDKVELEAPVDQDQLTGNYTKEAIKFIEQNRNRPFFLYMPHTAPHIPLHAGEDFKGKSKAGLYGDSVEEVDWSVGQVIDTLREHGLVEDTLIIFTSDNGPWYQGSNGQYRGRKREVFEGGHRVPFIAKWKGQIPEGIESDEMCMGFDLFVTFLTISGLPIPKDRIIDGVDIMPLLHGEDHTPHDELYFYWRSDLWAIRWGDWKYHREHQVTDINPNPWPVDTFKGPYLFNLETDPQESYDLIENHPEIAQELEAKMDLMDIKIRNNQRGWKLNRKGD